MQPGVHIEQFWGIPSKRESSPKSLSSRFNPWESPCGVACLIHEPQLRGPRFPHHLLWFLCAAARGRDHGCPSPCWPDRGGHICCCPAWCQQRRWSRAGWLPHNGPPSLSHRLDPAVTDGSCPANGCVRGTEGPHVPRPCHIPTSPGGSEQPWSRDASCVVAPLQLHPRGGRTSRDEARLCSSVSVGS